MWKSHPNLSLSQRKRWGTLKTFSITKLIGATYLIQKAQWVGNCLKTDVALFVQSLCMRHRCGQKSSQIIRGREVKRKRHLWGCSVYWKSFCKQMKESVLCSICSMVVHQWVGACTHCKMKPHTGEVKCSQRASQRCWCTMWIRKLRLSYKPAQYHSPYLFNTLVGDIIGLSRDLVFSLFVCQNVIQKFHHAKTNEILLFLGGNMLINCFSQ